MALQQNAASATRARSSKRALPSTDQYIALMSDGHYMDDLQKEFFRARLIAAEEQLRDRSRAGAAELAVAAGAADLLDRASAEEEHKLAIAGRVRDALQLVEVVAALRRLDNGTFGFCRETGEMIGIGRLLAYPTTTLCLEAQQRREIQSTRSRG